MNASASGVFDVKVYDDADLPGRRPPGQWFTTWRWWCAACPTRSLLTFATKAEARLWLAEHEHRAHDGPATEREPLGRLDPAGNRNGGRLGHSEGALGADGMSGGATTALRASCTALDGRFGVSR